VSVLMCRAFQARGGTRPFVRLHRVRELRFRRACAGLSGLFYTIAKRCGGVNQAPSRDRQAFAP